MRMSIKLAGKSFLLLFVLVSFFSCRAASKNDFKNDNARAEKTTASPIPSSSVAEKSTPSESPAGSPINDTEADRKLINAAKAGDDAQVKQLLAQGANPNASVAVRGTGTVTPLTSALAASHESTARLLLDANAKADQPGDFVNRGFAEKDVMPLQLAARNGMLEIVKLLISKGANVNAVSSLGNSALMTGEVGIIKYLLAQGANPNLKNNDGDTPLIFLIGYLKTYSEDEVDEGVKALLEKGAEVNAVNKKGESALSRTDTIGSEKTSEMLKKAGAK